jgi:restriction endonuclease S subunit
MPAGVFENTSIKTCVFYFIKKREGSDVLTLGTKLSKSVKGGDRTYRFVTEHQTTVVDFYDGNPENGAKHLLVSVPIDRIVHNSYSLNYAEYRSDEGEKEQYDDGVVVKSLGDVCTFLPKSKRPASYGNTQGLYPFFTSSQECKKYCDEPDYTIECVIVGSGGTANVKYSPHFSCSADNFVMCSRGDVNIKYVYYLLYHNIDLLQNGFFGVGLQHISKEYIQGIQIPIPSLERQEQAVEYLDFIYESMIKTSHLKIAELKRATQFCLTHQARFGENVVKELGEISIINPENMKSGQYTEINYIDIASVKGGNILELQKLSNDFPSRAKRIVKKGDILYSSVRPNLKGYVYISDDIQNGIASTGFADIRVKEPNTILSKYLYYIMTSDYISEDLISKAKGAQYPAVSFDDFETIKIPVPSIEHQKEIIEYMREGKQNFFHVLERIEEQ